jgi:dihydrofolate reductase
MSMWISIIVAVAQNGVIGRNNEIPWRLADDMRFFRRMTLHKPIIMGRRTFQSIGRPLPKRHNIIMTRDPLFKAEGCTVVHSVEEALAAANGAEEVVVIGGETIYEQFLPLADRIYLTQVAAVLEGDVNFPPYRPQEWGEVLRESFSADSENEYDFEIIVLERTD